MRYLLIFLAILFVVVIIFQILSIYDLANFLKKKDGFEVTERQSKIQGRFIALAVLALFGLIIYEAIKYGPYLLPKSASVEGVEIDFLSKLTWWIILIVFVLTHLAIAYFCSKFYYREGKKAAYLVHNNKLELIWTLVPTITLTIIILFSLNTWNNIMKPIPANKQHILINLHGQQFQWTARYAGRDGQLGRANVNLMTPTDPLGVDSSDSKSWDDKIVLGEFHLPVGIPVQFHFTSQDVIHSAFMPYFRAQMNVVPGMTTEFKFTPKYTTAQMRKITKNPKFNYILLCNNICGAGHFNMKMKIVVDTPQDYFKWIAQQKPFLPNGKKTSASLNTTKNKTILTAQLHKN